MIGQDLNLVRYTRVEKAEKKNTYAGLNNANKNIRLIGNGPPTFRNRIFYSKLCIWFIELASPNSQEAQNHSKFLKGRDGFSNFEAFPRENALNTGKFICTWTTASCTV